MEHVESLYHFSKWVLSCKGAEKQDGRTFLELLFKAWGWQDCVEAGVSFEHKIINGGAGGGDGFADAVVEGEILIEMKSKGEDLSKTKHFSQLKRYWFNLTPKTKYAVLCNFNEFWIYDFNVQVDTPVDKLKIVDIANRWTALSFLSKKPTTPLFGNNQIEITKKQARAMGELFFDLRSRSKINNEFSELEAQRFVLQCVFCMFAEDRNLLPERYFSRALDLCKRTKESTFDVLGGLFQEMNSRGKTAAGRFKGVPYFNGGLFSEIPKIALSEGELNILYESANEDWRTVRPSIFGNIFEASSNWSKRHTYGQHFTSEIDIYKVIRPTIIEPWEEKIDAAKNINQMEDLLIKLQNFKVLDPACGSGNFLYLAYNALKDIENELIQKISERRKSKSLKDQSILGFVGSHQFFGIDTDPFAVELAKVTLMIGKKVAQDRLNLTERQLPLDNLDSNIIKGDALFIEWPEVNAIIGNPPFLGCKRLKKELGEVYVEKLYQRFPECANFADLCCYWFQLANNKLKEGDYAGLVATNMIRKGTNKKASLEYIANNGGFIKNAITDQKWSGEANVHVSIVNWSKTKPSSFFLDGVLVNNINNSLLDEINTDKIETLIANRGFYFVGDQATGKGFEIDENIAKQWLLKDPINEVVIKPSLTARDCTRRPFGEPEKWVIDFNEMTLEEAEKFKLPFNHVYSSVRNERQENSDQKLKMKWWLHARPRPEMRVAIEKEKGYFAIPRHSKWVIPIAMESNVLPNSSVVVIAGSDLYLLAILNSSIHRKWIFSIASTLKGDTRYTPSTVFGTFPFPQLVKKDLIKEIRRVMSDLNEYRNKLMDEKGVGITAIYNQYMQEPASKLKALHNLIDSLVMKAYGFHEEETVLEELLKMNSMLSTSEKNGVSVVGPWDPSS